MKRLRLVLYLLLSAAQSGYSGGAISFDGVNDWYDCGPYDMDTGVEQVTVMAWVTPQFDSTSGAVRGIIGNWNPAGCFTGFKMEWNGTQGRFLLLHSRSLVAPCPPTPTVSFCHMTLSFSAGDLLGLYGTLKDGVQLCEGVNFTTGVNVSGPEFRSSDIINSNLPLLIGHAGDNDPWLGEIHQLILVTGSSVNANLWQMPAISKFRFFPQWSGSQGANGGGGSDPSVLDGVWNFEDQNLGQSPSTLETLSGNLECVAVGNPISVATTMMR